MENLKENEVIIETDNNETEKVNIENYIDNCTISIEFNSIESSIVTLKNGEFEKVKIQSIEKVNQLIKSLFSDRTGNVSTGFSWVGIQPKLELCKKMCECGYSYRKNQESIKKDGKEIPELKKYHTIYNDIYDIYNALTDKIVVKADDEFKGHTFTVFNIDDKGFEKEIFTFARTNYLSCIDRKLKTHAKKLQKIKDNKEKATKKVIDTIELLKQTGFSQADLLALLNK